MWGTDYIANHFLNWNVSRTTIKNLRWQLGGKIIRVTFRRSSTSLVQQLKKKLVYKNFATGYWEPLSLFNFFLTFWDQWCWRFSEGYLNNFSTKLSSQIFDCCLRNFLIQEERIGNVVSTSHWITPVIIIHAQTLSPLSPFSHIRTDNWIPFFSSAVYSVIGRGVQVFGFWFKI